ncbi:MAG: DUF4136 domain-containing protein [Gammaproteobacteria bacterium]|nr:DUF4136 domain-containing protein [Gammaproteobacteria bacterium]
MRLVFLLSVLFIQACVVKVGDHTPRVNTSVSSLASEDSSTFKSYVLIPSSNSVSINDLQFKEFSSYVKRLLKKNGYKDSQDRENPDLVIFVGYGIGEPEQSQYTYSMPIFGTTPTGVYTLNATSTNNGGTTQLDGTLTQQRALAVTGYSTHTNIRTNYTRHLELYAVNLSEYQLTGEVLPVWQSTVVSRGSNGDLRYVFPYLVAALDGLVGIDSGSSVDVTVRQDSLVKRYVQGLESIIPSD